jgi:hypothetical protein
MFGIQGKTGKNGYLLVDDFPQTSRFTLANLTLQGG